MDGDQELARLLIPPSSASLSQFQDWFTTTATSLTHSWLLCAQSPSTSSATTTAFKVFRLAELEFYLHREPDHPDPFSHRHPDQRSRGRWYFHKLGGSYRGGTWKGLDITFGGRQGSTESGSDGSDGAGGTKEEDGNDTFGGLLIRALEPYGTLVVPKESGESDAVIPGSTPTFTPSSALQSLIEGPSLCVDHLLGVLDSPSIKHFVDERLGGGSPPTIVTSTAAPLCLLPASLFESFSVSIPPVATLYTSPRVGLTLPPSKLNTDELLQLRARYLKAPYRFLLRPAQAKKGRQHVAIGALWSHAGECSTMAQAAQKVAPLVGVPVKSVASWLEAYESARVKAKGGRATNKGGGSEQPSTKKVKLSHGLEAVRQHVGKTPKNAEAVCGIVVIEEGTEVI
ncbi:hypothetical protein M427DRAFT_181607 [Gonapodya prolifera JEL478]|uniref:Uncharacterized protein n=1 Tax=Gonapodya prolifera (strain JEL478) TaxID=1344416 RepID=A0A139AQN6_GONPJ|nr:hypothetical protein M427DRAFT_181607 [Gonapodya prolifera JEL478]|eukprot:KXS19038.1 hypothetical protein M427DRAFT_181607 [Gonapodya prolifera JEL478]